MKSFLKKKYSKLIFVDLCIIISLIIIFIFVNSSFVNFMPSCYWQKNYDITCPSCGSTRCIISFMKGDFISSFLYNPFLFVLITYLLLLNLLYIINTILNKNYFNFFYPKWWYIIVYFSIWAIYTIIINII